MWLQPIVLTAQRKAHNGLPKRDAERKPLVICWIATPHFIRLAMTVEENFAMTEKSPSLRAVAK